MLPIGLGCILAIRLVLSRIRFALLLFLHWGVANALLAATVFERDLAELNGQKRHNDETNKRVGQYGIASDEKATETHQPIA